MNDIYTEDLAEFGTRELKEAGKLLTAIGRGLPDDFYQDGIKVGFNKWLKFVIPLVLILTLVSVIFLTISVYL